MRVTRRDLQIKLDALNKDGNRNWEIDYYQHGGYQLVLAGTGSRVTERMTAKELYQFLTGALAIIWGRYPLTPAEPTAKRIEP